MFNINQLQVEQPRCQVSWTNLKPVIKNNQHFFISIAKFAFVFVSVYVSVNVLLIIADAFWCTRCDRDGKREQQATGKRNCVLRGLVRCRTWSEMMKEKGSTRVCKVAKMNYRRNADAAAGGYSKRNRVEGRCVGRTSDSLADKFLWADFAEDSRKFDVKSTAWSFG